MQISAISFSSRKSSKRGQQQHQERIKALADRTLQQVAKSPMHLSIVDFCTCNNWDWIIQGASFFKTDKRHKKSTSHPFSLRLISPQQDNTAWVQFELNRRPSKRSPAKKLVFINGWVEKTPKGFIFHQCEESKRKALEDSINKFGREVSIETIGYILLDQKAIRGQNQSKKWTVAGLFNDSPQLIKTLAKAIQAISNGIIVSNTKIIADDAEKRKTELAQFLDLKT